MNSTGTAIVRSSKLRAKPISSLSFSKKELIHFYVNRCFAVCMAMSGALRGQKRTSDLLELQMIVSHCVGAGNRTWVRLTTVPSL